MLKKIIVPIIAITALTLSGCSAAEPAKTKLVFAGAPLTPAVDGKPNSFQIMLDLISEETGLPVEYKDSTDRGAIIEGMVSGQIDFAATDPYGYVLATELDKNIQLAGAYTRGKELEPGFKSFAIARANDKTINSLADLEGKTVCFSDPASTAGFLYPVKGLKDAGFEVSPAGDGKFKSVFTGIVPFQPAVNVFKGTCDVGFVPDTQWFGVMKTLKDLDESKLKIVWQSEHVPGSVLMVGSHLSSELQKKIIDTVVTKANKTYLAESGACTSEADCNFLNIANWGYVAATDSQYDPVRKTCVEVGIKQCEAK